MTSAQEKYLWQEGVLPVILGNGLAAHKLSITIYHRYGVLPLLCARKRSAWDFLNPVCRFLRLYGEEHSPLWEEQLMDLAHDETGCLLLLIPVTERDRKWTEASRSRLEPYYILTSKDKLFNQRTPFLS